MHLHLVCMCLPGGGSREAHLADSSNEAGMHMLLQLLLLLLLLVVLGQAADMPQPSVGHKVHQMRIPGISKIPLSGKSCVRARTSHDSFSCRLLTVRILIEILAAQGGNETGRELFGTLSSFRKSVA